MASKALKGLTVKIGGDTSELTKSLDKVEKQGRSLSSELGQINKLLKLDPKNTELLAQKQKVLADAIGATEKKLDTLKEAEKQVQAQFERGEVSEAQYRALQREIIETEAKLGKYKNAAKETADAVEELAKESKEAAAGIEKTEKEAQEADDALADMGASAADAAKTGFTAVATAATAAVAAVVALAEESREYRTEMGKLDVAFQDNNHSAEAATKTYEALQSILGETDQAVEASNNLAALCTSEEELNDWTEILTGVYAKFGASLPVEGLAEAANETKRVGQVTGPLADALNWAAEEGADFGVVLKENIDFTELSKKELDKLTDSQKAEYEARKKQHDEIEAYNKKVEEAASAEDKFNIALENCADEQERQQLITKTLTKIYGSAATQYKKTNKEVIRANEATEKWNKATAKLGKTVEPAITDVKEFGIALLEDAEEPLEKVTKFVRTKFLPALKNFSSWTSKNLPKIKAGVAGVATALVAYKAATIATELASKGLTVATIAQTAAQKALNLAMKASPVGLAVTALAGATAAMIALSAATKKAQQPVQVLTDEEQALVKASAEAAEAFREQQKATEEALGDISAEMKHTQDLADELRGLADASGAVQEKDQARAQFILNELNEALGTEYAMVDGVIQKYTELEGSIQDVILAKTANALVEAANADYLDAIKMEAEAWDSLVLAEEEHSAAIQRTKEAKSEYLEFNQQYLDNLLSGYYENNEAIKSEDQSRLMALFENWQTEEGYLTEKETKYDEAATFYGNYFNTISNYEDAQTAVLEGNYQKAVDILAKKGGTYTNFSDTVDEETAKVLSTLHKEAVNAGLKADLTKRNFENGVEGYTEEMVTEAEKNYQEAMDEFATAYADAEAVGEDLSEGMTQGAENKRSGLLAKARSLVSGFLEAARKAADSHSPSRKAIALFEDIGEGAEIGVENKTPDVARAGTKQATALLDAYREQEVSAEKALRNVADQQVARMATGQMTAATANSGALEAILAAIKEGQVLLLDGDVLVGGTADRMDRRLGQLRVLTARGAK